ncbi:MAG: uroporphyrinogen-III C-methyltransferase [Saprospiraceae bacterium]|nr:uroporphyrinogen-III C-methyltransferase [Saprospiraceae bacterium]
MPTIPKITLVGAGPGDPDLITVKGLKALQTADVVLYDALANEALLSHAPRHALKVCVGKRAGKHSIRQENIESLMVKLAFEKGHVVRLKGGDPYVFGRGHEELEFIQPYGIQVQVVPGISSAIAVPGSQGIPVTRRDVSESFWVVTATTKSGAFSQDIKLAAASSATVVILMGLKKIGEIVKAYQNIDKGNEPVMVVQNGTLPGERWVISTIDEIEEEIRKTGISTPAIIVVGKVVNLHPAIAQKIQAAAV